MKEGLSSLRSRRETGNESQESQLHEQIGRLVVENEFLRKKLGLSEYRNGVR